MTDTSMPQVPFTTREALASGFSYGSLAALVQQGHLSRPLRGVYAPGEWPDDLRCRAAAAARVLRPDQVFVDRTAAWLHGIDAFGYAELGTFPPIETCVPGDQRASRAYGVRGRRRALLPDDVAIEHGVRATTPLRTALDLACNLRRADALACLDAYARTYGITPEALRDALPRFAGRRGIVQARALVGLIDPRSESARESRLRLALVDAGLPRPDSQVEVEVSGHLFRLDHAYREHRVAIEYDGAEFHSGHEQVAHDELRRDLLRDAGWTVIVVRLGDFTGLRLEAWLLEVRAALAGQYTTLRW